MLWRYVLLLTVVLGTISTFTVQQREAFRQSVCTLRKPSSSHTFQDRVDWATTTAVALAATVVIWVGCRVWLGDIHVKFTLPLDFNVKSRTPSRIPLLSFLREVVKDAPGLTMNADAVVIVGGTNDISAGSLINWSKLDEVLPELKNKKVIVSELPPRFDDPVANYRTSCENLRLQQQGFNKFENSAKSFLQMVHFYKTLSVELIRKKNPLMIFQSAKNTSLGSEIALTNSKIAHDDEATAYYLNQTVSSDRMMLEDSVFRSQRELILNLQDHLNAVNEQKKAMRQRLDTTLRYQKTCHRELEVTKQQLATLNSQFDFLKQTLEEKTLVMESLQRDLTSAYYNRKTLIRQIELLKVELMSQKLKAPDEIKDVLSLKCENIKECKTQRGKLDLRRVRKTFKKLDQSITESLSKMNIQPASWTELCNSDEEGNVFQQSSAEIYEVPVVRVPVPNALTPVEHNVEWLVAWTETESMDSLQKGNNLDNLLKANESGNHESPVSTDSDSDSDEDKPVAPRGISGIVDAIMRYSGSSRESSSSGRRRRTQIYQEDHVSSSSDVEEHDNERMITGSPAFQKLMESFLSQTAVN